MKRRVQNFLLAAVMLPCLSLAAQEPPQEQKTDSDPIGIYFGGFGGWVFPYDVTITQRGTAFHADFEGGPLPVEAPGTATSSTNGLGGGHIGYEWMKRICKGFRLAPAIEVEGTYFTSTPEGRIVNFEERLLVQDFIVTLPMRIGTLLANGILEFNNDYISPYMGIGVGVGFVSIHDANSSQIDPAEVGINHFNSDPNDFNSLFTTQAKAGLRYRFFKHYRLSAEYRFIYLTSSHFTFGSTNYPTHVPTSPWMVKVGAMAYNTVTLGMDFIF